MVEPEPVEYVRVCDVYGTGFFYIPGTETCLKIGGYVRMRLNAAGDIEGTGNDRIGVNARDLDDANRDYDFNTQTRGRLEFDAREETELGMLRAFARLEATNISGSDLGYGTSNNGVNMPQAFIQLGGVTMGRLDSLWATGDGLYTDNDWSVGDLSNNQVRYTFATNGFTISASAEDEGDGDAIPDVVAQIAYKSAWGSVYVSGVYDEDAYDPNLLGGVTRNYAIFGKDQGDNEDGAFAVKAGAEIKDLIYLGGSLKIEGHYAFDPTEYASLAPGNYLIGIQAQGTSASGTFATVSLPEEWQIGGGYKQSFGKLTAYLSGIYGQTFDIGYANGTEDNANIWGVAGSLGYQVTSNFSVLGEVSYRDVDLSGGFNDLNQTRGFVEFKRSF
ncbi:porin [Aureimonas psammosilenae]|uniref:porin n=1 Tax=Aureimonas psammosilenae TaxID=2495496 RepID=UPI001F24FD68|nr:porin [Aureimonas psammosilenae]